MLTYIARTGQEIPLASEADCAAAIRVGDLHRESLVMDGGTGRWMKAAEHSGLAGLLARVRVTRPIRAAPAGLKAAVLTAWLVALLAPPALAWAIGADPLRILPSSLLYTVALAALSAIAGLFLASRRGRWGLGLACAILALAGGLAGLVESTDALRTGLVPTVTSLFAPGAK
ncbi:MAG: hypothetical protein ACREUT_22155 [Steroidobacteraceae bacterium]